jgi:hypothetical protein
MLYELWLKLGLKKQWITVPFCDTHEGYLNLTDEQIEEFDDGGDPCVVVMQLLKGN